jgi:ABC-2 type transport system permease protein
MYKTGLIIKREYLSRVRNKTFLLTTFLLPAIFILFVFGSALFTTDQPDPELAQTANTVANYNIGMVCGTLIYLTIIIFGTMVMRGVKEEKINRIAEIIISSVTPFELMAGKILGIAAVALTQLLLWFSLIAILLFGASYFISHDMIQHTRDANLSLHGAAAIALKLSVTKQTMAGINIYAVMGCFLFYFLGGFLFYASLFAAVGSAINEDSQDTQSLALPIAMPIFFAFIIMSSNLKTPDTPVMIWTSIIPFTSPVVMMGRMPGGVPAWQLALSIASLITGFILTTWIAAKIYRTGILLYGKKVSWKEMFKWATRK